MDTFESSAADLARFAEKQGYPPNLLWVTSADMVFWRLRFFVWMGDPTERRKEAKRRFDGGIARNIGLALEASKTAEWTICRVYLPKDREEAEYRMLPSTGMKMNVAKDPPPVVLVKSRVAWWMLKLWAKTSRNNLIAAPR